MNQAKSPPSHPSLTQPVSRRVKRRWFLPNSLCYLIHPILWCTLLVRFPTSLGRSFRTNGRQFGGRERERKISSTNSFARSNQLQPDLQKTNTRTNRLQMLVADSYKWRHKRSRRTSNIMNQTVVSKMFLFFGWQHAHFAYFLQDWYVFSCCRCIFFTDLLSCF